MGLDGRKATRITQQMLERKFNVAGEYLVAVAVKNTSSDSGQTAQSFSKRVIKKGNAVILQVSNSVKWFPYIEFGTGIYAENGKGRKTPWITPLIKIGGKWKHIRTSGSKANPTLRPLLKLKNQVRYILEKA